MDTIKKGTHGVLTNTNSGVTIPGTLFRDWNSVGDCLLKIDGDTTNCSNRFPVNAGWTFEPDIQLPTEVGSIIEIGTSGSGVWMLLDYGKWVSTSDNHFTPGDLLALAKQHGNFKVVR